MSKYLVILVIFQFMVPIYLGTHYISILGNNVLLNTKIYL